MQNSMRDLGYLKIKSPKLNKHSICLILIKVGQLTQEVHSFIIKDLKVALDSLGFDSQNQTIYQMISDLDADGAGNIGFD